METTEEETTEEEIIEAEIEGITVRNDDELNRINGVREMLNFLEGNPEIPLPSLVTFDSYVWIDNENQDPKAEDPKAEMAKLARAMKPVKKVSNGSYFSLRKKFGAVTLGVNIPREDVCKKIVTGTEEVEAFLIKAYTREIVEWVCPDSLLEA